MTGLRARPPGPANEGMLSGAADPRAGDGAFAGR
jgi:hypothetical protein